MEFLALFSQLSDCINGVMPDLATVVGYQLPVRTKEDPTYTALSTVTPRAVAGSTPESLVKLSKFRWQTHCRGLYQLPVAV